jgi:hypothetical protein
MAGYVDEFKNLDLHDEYVQLLVKRLLKATDATLERRILDNSTLAKAKSDLRASYQVALIETDFVKNIEQSTVKVIVNSSYVQSVVQMPKQDYTNRLLKQKLIYNDDLKMSSRIRKNTKGIIQTQQRILFEGLEAGKSIVKLTREVKNADIFEEALPKYINNLTSVRVDGDRVLTPAQVNDVKKQISKIKNKGLKRDYERLVNRIVANKPIEKAVANAIDSKTRSLSYRVTQNQTHATVSRFKADTATNDHNTKYVKTQTYGEITCAYCLGLSDLGYVPVENATLPPHHPSCDCQPKFRKTVRDVEPWTKEEYQERAEEAVNKRNQANKKKGQPLTYLKVQPAENLRENSLTEQLKNTKP